MRDGAGDLKTASYQSMSRIEGRLLANVRQMLRYQEDSGVYRYTDRPPETELTFNKTSINHYPLDLGLPSEPEPDQWKAVCLALQKAKERVAADPETSATIDFQIRDIA
ncbi:hypothetical protein GOB93_10875 [Acetobacter musti]|uniref:Uncharacterized protein n=1 Tax=Acetobacter musti TaxID=864732 RepID=A0ABX0JNV7_9PROT|nr:hypothetical protein [Acetobacter musti]NHN85141.1 hypothetical protein [Acetobacter musti]